MSIKAFLNRKKILWLIALLLLAIIKIFSLNKEAVELFYSSQIYVSFSKILRFLFGWIPFSLGDILYLMAGAWLLWKFIKNIILVFKKQLRGKLLLKKILKLVLGSIFIYIIFNIFWGLNYNRKGITSQLEIKKTDIDTTDILILQNILLQKVNLSKVTLMHKRNPSSNKEIFERAQKCYIQTEKIYPFLHYKVPSLKSSLYGWLGNYLGFTGYYNPFTGEAQVNTNVPEFLQPYIATHEIAHQLGYAKENEANFAGYLAAVNSTDTLFHYSCYLDLYMYANYQIYYFDSTASKQSLALLMPEVKKDILEWKHFNLAHQSFIEPLITWMYGNYLKLNEQPKGMRSYNQVISMLISYYKKFGRI